MRSASSVCPARSAMAPCPCLCQETRPETVPALRSSLIAWSPDRWINSHNAMWQVQRDKGGRRGLVMWNIYHVWNLGEWNVTHPPFVSRSLCLLEAVCSLPVPLALGSLVHGLKGIPPAQTRAGSPPSSLHVKSTARVSSFLAVP